MLPHHDCRLQVIVNQNELRRLGHPLLAHVRVIHDELEPCRVGPQVCLLVRDCREAYEGRHRVVEGSEVEAGEAVAEVDELALPHDASATGRGDLALGFHDPFVICGQVHSSTDFDVTMKSAGSYICLRKGPTETVRGAIDRRMQVRLRISMPQGDNVIVADLCSSLS